LQQSVIVLVVLLALVVFGFVAFVLYLPIAQMRAKIPHRTEVQKALLMGRLTVAAPRIATRLRDFGLL
jgi:hypothetical protein